MKSRCLLALLAVAWLGTTAAQAGEVKGVVTATGLRSNADCVVYVDSIPGHTFSPPKAHALVDQKNLVFSPHVLPILRGTTVDFKNSDAVLHNVFSPDKCCDTFNLGSWPQGQSRSYTFKDRCVSTLLCKVHPEMEGFVLSLPTPYFAVTDKAGAYTIKDLPDGDYTIKVWNQKFKKEASKQVKVSGPTAVNIELKK